MVTASFKEGQKTAITTSLQKYDYGEVLRIKGLSLPRYVAVQFAVDGMSEALPSSIGETVEDVTDVLIPNSLLRSNIKPWNYNIMAYVYIVSGSSGKTEYTITIPVKWRPKTGDDQAADDDVAAVIGSAVEKMNTATTKAENAANQASATAEEIKADREKITTNEVEISELKGDLADIDKTAIKTYAINMATPEKISRNSEMSGTKETLEDGRVSFSSTVSYGRYNYVLENIKTYGTRRVYFVVFRGEFTVNVNPTNKSGLTSFYVYKNSQNQSTATVLDSDYISEGTGAFVYRSLHQLKDTQTDADRFDVGLMIGENCTAVFDNHALTLVDVTELYNHGVTTLDDLEATIGTEYFDVKQGLTAFAQTAQTAQIAQIAQIAQTAQTAQTVENDMEFTIRSRRSSDFTSDGTTCNFTPTQFYFGIIIRSDFGFLKDGNLLVVFESDFYVDGATFVLGQEKSGGSGYELTKNCTVYVKDNKYYYFCIIPVVITGRHELDVYFNRASVGYENVSHTITVKKFGYAMSDTVTETMIDIVCSGKTLLDSVNEIGALNKKIEELDTSIHSSWKGKNALVIGDSITAAKKWQLELTNLLGMNVTTHAKGGIGTVKMVDGDNGLGGDYDNETDASGTLRPLTAEDVTDIDLIVVAPAYNDRGKEDGVVGDCYNPDGTGQNTISGIIQYTINRIFEELTNSNNLTCKVLYVTPYCHGKYPYIDADGYDEYPSGTGRTAETLGKAIIDVCNHNNIPVCDLWHNSCINKFTWNIHGASSNPVNEKYSPYQLDESGNPVSETRIRYIKGQSYYQWRDGAVVLEEYTGASPYPYNGDQLHCSALGYKRIGECICGSIIANFGN